MIRTDRPHLTVAALSHAGETGKNNEDAYSVTSYVLEVGRLPALLAVVADGIGGHQAGEIAARLAVDTVVRALGGSTGRDPVAMMRSAIIEAGKAIQREASADPDYEGMGSTIALGWVIGDRLYAATVGDSRLYIQRQGTLRRLSTDHTWVQEAIDHGVISPEEARSHPHAHVLRRHLGGAQDAQPDLRLRLTADETEERSLGNQGLRLKAEDILLLCTDGLTDLVTDDEIQRQLASPATPEEAAHALVVLARGRGGFDNVTVLLARVPASIGKLRRRGMGPALVAGLLGGLALLLLVAVSAAVMWWLGYWPW